MHRPFRTLTAAGRIPHGLRTRKPLAILSLVALMLGGLITAMSSGGASATTASASPLLFGENLDLFPGTTGSDWFLSQPALRAGLVSAHVQVIRLPIRGSSPSTGSIANWPEVQAALTDIKAMGITPLIILRNPQDPTLLTDDTQVVNYVKSLFGGSPVYYEWANETDLPGNAGQVSAATYLASWNSVVPQLKPLAGPAAQFIGPVNYQYDPSYLQTFLAGANPLPDAISWHNYTCNDATDSEATCLANIDHWATNIAAAQALMTSTIGKQLPIWITEWNYTPTVTASDSKHTDTAFLQQWTTKALQALAADGVAGSMHFNVNNLGVTNGSFPLVNFDGSLAPEGVAFSAAYSALVNPGPSPSPTTPTPSPTTPTPSPTTPTPSPTTPTPSPTTPPPGPSPQYSFEDGTLSGWDSDGNVTSMVNSSDVAGQDGTRELKVVFHSTGSGDFPTLHASPASTIRPVAGQALSAWFYAPSSTATTVTAKLFYQDPVTFKWIIGPSTVISQRGAWVKLSMPVTGISAPSHEIGIQFQESPFSTDSTIYMDSVAWS